MLDHSTIHRNLDGKIKILGLEAPDILLVLMLAAIMNLFFGQTKFTLIMVFGIPSLLLTILYFSKKDKPENYLIHLIRFLVMPKFYSAGHKSRNHTKMKGKFYE